MPISEIGAVEKLTAQLDTNNLVQYQLPLATINSDATEQQSIALNPIIGKTLTLNFHGKIACKHCGKATKKSYSQGFCYPCMIKLAQCDMCIMKPETCHHHLGTCREPQWGEQHCMVDHYVYLSNTSALKVGITRHTQIPTRWIDQGAHQATVLLEVPNRYLAGIGEVALKNFFSDKTNWRKMLQNDAEPINWEEARNQALEGIPKDLKPYIIHEPNEIQDLEFPVLACKAITLS